MTNLPEIPFYHIDHLIAEGGTAKVYWGIDLRSGCQRIEDTAF